MDSPYFGRKNGKSRKLWGNQDPVLAKTTSNNSLLSHYDPKRRPKHLNSQELDLQYLGTDERNGSKSHPCIKTQAHLRPGRGYDLAMDETHFPRLGGSGTGNNGLQAANHPESEADSLSVDYEPTPKKGHYRIGNRDNIPSRGDLKDSKRSDSHLYQRGNAGPTKLTSPSGSDLRSTSFNVEDLHPSTFCGYHGTNCLHCNVHGNGKRTHTSDARSNVQQLLLRVLSNDAIERRSSPSLPMMPLMMEEADFLTPMLLSSSCPGRSTNAQDTLVRHIRIRHAEQTSKARGTPGLDHADQTHTRLVHAGQVGRAHAFLDIGHADRTGTRFHVGQVHAEYVHGRVVHTEEAGQVYSSTGQIHARRQPPPSEQLQASSQYLLSILAENLALSMSDVDFINIVLKQRKRRMSYTKILTEIASSAGEDTQFRPSALDHGLQTLLPHAEFKRFRSIYT